MRQYDLLARWVLPDAALTITASPAECLTAGRHAYALALRNARLDEAQRVFLRAFGRRAHGPSWERSLADAEDARRGLSRPTAG